jgi:hypothetical protein
VKPDSTWRLWVSEKEKGEERKRKKGREKI